MVLVDDPHAESPGGIILPDMAKDKPQRGTVIAVGPGKLLESGVTVTPSVAEGDKVLFAKYSGVEVEQHGRPVLIMREEDILAKL